MAIRIGLRVERGTFAQRKRPVSMRSWARVLGLNFIGVGAIGVDQGDLVAGALMILAGLGMVAWWAAGRRDPRFQDFFPYAYVADLQDPPEPDLTRQERAVNAFIHSVSTLVAWLLFTPQPFEACAVAWFVGIWSYEVSSRPSPAARRIAWTVALGAAAWFWLVGMLFGVRPGRAADAAFLGFVFARAIIFICAGWLAQAKQTPDRLTE